MEYSLTLKSTGAVDITPSVLCFYYSYTMLTLLLSLTSSLWPFASASLVILLSLLFRVGLGVE